MTTYIAQIPTFTDQELNDEIENHRAHVATFWDRPESEEELEARVRSRRTLDALNAEKARRVLTGAKPVDYVTLDHELEVASEMTKGAREAYEELMAEASDYLKLADDAFKAAGECKREIKELNRSVRKLEATMAWRERRATAKEIGRKIRAKLPTMPKMKIVIQK